MNIYDILFPPDSEYLGWVQFATLTKDKKMVSLGYADFTNIREKAENLKINKSQDYYIMVNTVKQFTTRNTENLFSLNNICIDFDIHSKLSKLPIHEKELLLDEFCWRLNRDLVSTGELPPFNAIHFTGRGVQIYWHLESTASSLLYLYQRAIDYFAVIIREFLKEYPTLERHIEIDINASKNPIGLFRMFDTYNTKAKMPTVTEIFHNKALNLNELVKRLEQESEPVKAYLKRKETIKRRYQKQELNNDILKEERTGGFSALHYKRIKIIEQLISEDNNCTGKRNTILFLSFNSARQIYPFATAKKICRKINNSFSEPLKSIEYIFKQEKVYQIKNETFFEKLGVTEEELINTGRYEMSRPNITRDLERNVRKQEQMMKKDMAKKLLLSGCKQKEVAERTHLSLSTVARISADIPKSKKRKK